MPSVVSEGRVLRPLQEQVVAAVMPAWLDVILFAVATAGAIYVACEWCWWMEERDSDGEIRSAIESDGGWDA